MPKQLDLVMPTWGGKRKGAGRPPKGDRAGAPHKPRQSLAATEPVHVTLRVVDDVGRLRQLDVWRALSAAAARALDRDDFRIVHLSIQGNHVHLIVEADDEVALARGMQGFQISAAKRINAAISERTGRPRRGQVFADRYHPEPLRSPRQARNALAYVLNNWRKHGEDRGEGARRGDMLDRYATGWHWDGWSEPTPTVPLRPDTELVPVAFPTTWLLTTGWRRHGLVSPWDPPGPRRRLDRSR